MKDSKGISSINEHIPIPISTKRSLVSEASDFVKYYEKVQKVEYPQRKEIDDSLDDFIVYLKGLKNKFLEDLILNKIETINDDMKKNEIIQNYPTREILNESIESQHVSQHLNIQDDNFEQMKEYEKEIDIAINEEEKSIEIIKEESETNKSQMQKFRDSRDNLSISVYDSGDFRNKTLNTVTSQQNKLRKSTFKTEHNNSQQMNDDDNSVSDVSQKKSTRRDELNKSKGLEIYPGQHFTKDEKPIQYNQENIRAGPEPSESAMNSPITPTYPADTIINSPHTPTQNLESVNSRPTSKQSIRSKKSIYPQENEATPQPINRPSHPESENVPSKNVNRAPTKSVERTPTLSFDRQPEGSIEKPQVRNIEQTPNRNIQPPPNRNIEQTPPPKSEKLVPNENNDLNKQSDSSRIINNNSSSKSVAGPAKGQRESFQSFLNRDKQSSKNAKMDDSVISSKSNMKPPKGPSSQNQSSVSSKTPPVQPPERQTPARRPPSKESAKNIAKEESKLIERIIDEENKAKQLKQNPKRNQPSPSLQTSDPAKRNGNPFIRPKPEDTPPNKNLSENQLKSKSTMRKDQFVIKEENESVEESNRNPTKRGSKSKIL